MLSPIGPLRPCSSESIKYPNSGKSPATYPKNVSLPSNSIPYHVQFVQTAKNLQITIGSFSSSCVYRNGSFEVISFVRSCIYFTPFLWLFLENIISGSSLPASDTCFSERGEVCKGEATTSFIYPCNLRGATPCLDFKRNINLLIC